MLSQCYELSNRLLLHTFCIEDMTSIKALDYIKQRGMYWLVKYGAFNTTTFAFHVDISAST